MLATPTNNGAALSRGSYSVERSCRAEPRHLSAMLQAVGGERTAAMILLDRKAGEGL